MEETTSNLLIEVLKIYGLPGVLLILTFLLIIIAIYRLGPTILNEWKLSEKKEHDKKMQSSIKRGPKIQAVLREKLKSINLDHVFVAEFHNGSESITSIPYMKFDIIYEHMNPDYHGNDIFLSRLYENEHILTHDQLPELLFRNFYISYHVDDIKNLDEHLYLRMRSRGSKLFAANLICDKNGAPIAFVGGFNFDDKKIINKEELHNCASLLEKIYNE